MLNTQNARIRTFTTIAAGVGWFAVVLQFYLSLRLSVANGRGIGWGMFVYFGYFTVLTNILVALALAAPLVAPNAAIARFFRRSGVITAIAASITMVGIVYSLVLRQIWNPEGLQLVADRLLHDVMPIVFLIYWWIVVPKRGVRWADVPRWLVYPIGYLFYALVRGAASGVYPYPFLDVDSLGYGPTLINSFIMLAGFVAIALLLIGLNWLKPERVPVTERLP
ncbi:MAG: Pr6Pr family membrane protein [Kaiparowitsia implicata GSE-PSE-MK54-09C]|jgi:hypothetical protein|nr:Pr6Pr family membrane protein [Kaiparowitsia implicata GSE-PSE-MK54-09C]